MSGILAVKNIPKSTLSHDLLVLKQKMGKFCQKSVNFTSENILLQFYDYKNYYGN